MGDVVIPQTSRVYGSNIFIERVNALSPEKCSHLQTIEEDSPIAVNGDRVSRNTFMD